jgi:hypothetical protein
MKPGVEPALKLVPAFRRASPAQPVFPSSAGAFASWAPEMNAAASPENTQSPVDQSFALSPMSE